jgi:molybdate transport system regulatory protein
MAHTTEKYKIGSRIWISGEGGHFLGSGRVRLLEYIEKTGSITAAAKEMKMSYRQAWQMVQDMNAQSEQPLVSKTLGGKGGGGAQLTENGQKAIRRFYKIEKKINEFIGELNKNLNF